MGEVQSTTQSVVRTASGVAAPAVKSSFDFVTTTSPAVLGYFALAAVGVYLFGPAILSFALTVSRGYAGDITAAGALDSVLNSTNAFLIDIRTPVRLQSALHDSFLWVEWCSRGRKRGQGCWSFQGM